MSPPPKKKTAFTSTCDTKTKQNIQTRANMSDKYRHEKIE